VANSGEGPAYNVLAHLDTPSGSIDITDYVIDNYGTISAGTYTTGYDFDFIVDDWCVADETVPLTLEIVDAAGSRWTETTSIDLDCAPGGEPLMTLSEVALDDANGTVGGDSVGDGDGYPEPGESLEVGVTLFIFEDGDGDSSYDYGTEAGWWETFDVTLYCDGVTAGVSDLTVTAVSLVEDAGEPGDEVTVYVTVENLGDTDAVGVVYQVVFSGDEVIDADDAVVGTSAAFTKAAFSSDEYSEPMNVPALPSGTWTVGVIVDSAEAVAEADEGNNTGSAAATYLLTSDIDRAP